MAESPNQERRDSPRHWLVVLCLVGLDYFSTLAYLPSIAVESAGAFAPFAAAMIVAVTVLMALPVYLYVVGRSSEGQGTLGLLQRSVPGWRGKVLVLGLLGFAAADFVITRSLSVADATEHLMHNPHGHELLDQLAPVGERFRDWLGPDIYGRAAPFLTRPVLITLALSITTFGLWWLHKDGFTRTIVVLVVSVVSVYLALVGLVVGSGLVYLANHSSLVRAWYADLFTQGGGDIGAGVDGSLIRFWLTVAVWSLPQMCLALSGFELTMAVVPIVKGKRGESEHSSPSRIRDTRKLMVVAAALMAVFLTGSVFITTLLVPHGKMLAGGVAQHRALAYLAHGGEVVVGPSAIAPATELNPLFGPHFGNIFDAATIGILCLAGASVMVGLWRLVPGFLHRLGMDLSWAGRIGVITHLLNAVVLLVTIVFRASLSDQQWAYATSVLVLLAGAALAATIDVQARWRGSWLAPIAATPPAAVLCFLAVATGLTVYINRAGVTIALMFVATIFITSFVSRWLRSTELRFEGFDFADEASLVRWGQLCAMDRQVLVPHRPGPFSLAKRDEMIRREYFLSPDVPLAFIEVELGDTSDFYQRPRVRIERDGNLEIIRVSKAVSVAHVLAATGLEMARIGRPPILLFGWSFETPLAANLNFLFLGEGNIPWMVKALIHQATPDPDRQPRVVIG